MDKGILTHAKDFLVKNWKASDNVAMGVVPMGNIPMDGKVLRPGDMASQLKANKGVFYACSDLIGLGVGDTPLRVYVTSTGREKSNFKCAITRPVDKLVKDGIFRKAIPGTALSRANDLEEVLNGPLVDLLRQVNGYMNAFDAKKLTSVNMDLTGNAYWVLLRNAFDLPASVWFVPSQYMTVKASKEQWIDGYVYEKGTTKIEYPPEDIVHFKCVSPSSQFYGIAPLLACADAFNLREFMMNFETQLFRTGGNPKGIVWTKNPIDEKKGKDIKQKLKNMATGEWTVLYGDDFNIEPMSMPNARDMGYKEGLSFTRDEICMVMHVPESMLISENSNKGTSLAQKYHLAKYAVSPRNTQIDEKISEHLAPQFDERYVVLFDNVVPTDLELEREERKANLEIGVTTRNEERGKLALDPVDGGDELLVPMGMTPVDQAGTQIEQIATLATRKAMSKFPLMKKWHEAARGAA